MNLYSSKPTYSIYLHLYTFASHLLILHTHLVSIYQRPTLIHLYLRPIYRYTYTALQPIHLHLYIHLLSTNTYTLLQAIYLQLYTFASHVYLCYMYTSTCTIYLSHTLTPLLHWVPSTHPSACIHLYTHIIYPAPLHTDIYQYLYKYLPSTYTFTPPSYLRKTLIHRYNLSIYSHTPMLTPHLPTANTYTPLNTPHLHKYSCYTSLLAIYQY